MNERIKALAVEADFMLCEDDHFYSEGQSQKITKQLQKFAQLIVQECMRQVEEQYLPVLEDQVMMKDTHWDGYVQCGVDSYVAIREHFFGVEE
jgi:hypothetical protein